MNPVRTSKRRAKTALVASVALYTTLVAFNNATDYGSNFEFVRHVLMMDTTFPASGARWRAIQTPFLHHAAYAGIIAVEVLVALLAWLAAWHMWRSNQDTSQFGEARRIANTALVLGVMLWFTGFIAIGGEWFAMWQSDTWNGIQSAYRISTVLLLVLIFVNTDD